MFILVITDIIKSGSFAIVVGDFPELVERAFSVKLPQEAAVLIVVDAVYVWVEPNLSAS